MLDVRNFRKVYDQTVAVEGLSFELASGQILGLVGPNGSGKTTTMRAVAGILPPTTGQISVAGFDVENQAKSAKQRVAFVPDDPQLFETLTVWEHLMFVASLYQVVEFEAAASELLEMFQLTDKRDALASELSRGMKQKTAICCGYLQRPELIMFDEPHTGLDPLAIRRMKESIKIRAEQGASVIVSSHLLGLIEDLCTHLLILDRGKMKFHGTLESLRDQNPELERGATLEEIFFKTTHSPQSLASDD